MKQNSSSLKEAKYTVAIYRTGRIPLSRCVFIILEIIVHNEVQCRRIQDGDEHNFGTLDFLKLFEAISRTKETNLPHTRNSRKSDGFRNSDLQHLNSLARNAETLKHWLGSYSDTRANEADVSPPKDDLALIVETELINALSKKSSALLDRPFLQRKGRNDFLVLRPDIRDPFVTIIPNDIYYNVEKKCVNWLDDCNQKGLRNRLLKKVKSPF